MQPRHAALVLVAALAVVSASGCTYAVRPTPKIEAVPGSPLPLRAKYFIAPTERARVHSDTFVALGKVNTWNIEVGEGLATSFPDALKSAFVSVEAATGQGDVAGADVLLLPSIASFEVSGGSFTSILDVRVVVMRGGVVTLDEAFHGAPAEGAAGGAWLGGAFAGQNTLRRSSEYAFEDVMPKIVARLRAVLAPGPAPVPVPVSVPAS